MGWEYGIQLIEQDKGSKEQQAEQLLELLKSSLTMLDLGEMVIEQFENGFLIVDHSNKEWPHVAQIQVDRADIAIESIVEGDVYIYCLFHRYDEPIRRIINMIKEIIFTEDQWIEL